MARIKKKHTAQVSTQLWLITFADLMTLLLTFFVLLLSMSSITLSSVSQVDSFFKPQNMISYSQSGNIPQRIQLLLKEIRDPDLEQHKARIKDLLFPYEAIPKEMNRDKVMDNLDVLVTKEGLVIMITDSLLFEQGKFELTEQNKQFLTPLYEVMLYTNEDINISAYTDNQPPKGISSYSLASRRALSVLDFFLNEANTSGALKPNRMSISAYGPEKPVASNDTEAGRAKNRRVEILFKSTQWLGGYN